MVKIFENWKLKIKNSCREQAGFTLIELLVVITIIGILSSVVIVNLQQNRNKGKDASAKATMYNIPVQAEIYYDDNGGTYTGMCDLENPESSQMKRLIEGVQKQVSKTDPRNIAPCAVSSEGDSFTVNILLNNGDQFCVDTTGTASVLTPEAVITDGVLCKPDEQ